MNSTRLGEDGDLQIKRSFKEKMQKRLRPMIGMIISIIGSILMVALSTTWHNINDLFYVSIYYSSLGIPDFK
eukprot:403360475